MATVVPPRKVMRIIARLNVGGPALHCILLSEKLNSKGFETTLVAGQPESHEEGYDKFFGICHDTYRFVQLGKLRRRLSVLGDLSSFIALVKLIHREKPDVVHTHTAKAGVLGRVAAFLNRTPVVVHTFHGHVLHGYFNQTFSTLICWAEKWLARGTDAIITLSPGLKEELSARFGVAPPGKFRVIPLGRSLGAFFNTPRKNGQLRKELGISSDLKLIGTVGRMVPIKDQQSLLRACAKIEGWDWRLVLVGEGELRNELQSLSEKLGIASKVFFTGWRSDLEKIYSNLDLFVICSKNEGTPLSIIEAFASGCPVVATDVGGVRDLFSGDSPVARASKPVPLPEGYLVPAENSSLLAEGITQALSKNWSEASIRKRAENFSDDALAERISDLYAQLLAGTSIKYGKAALT